MEGIIKNPTKELMEPMHGGKIFSFPEGHIMQVPVPSAKHILNEYGQRGLISLNYGDDTRPGKNNPDISLEDEKSEAGVRANHNFQIRQVEIYNQDNETRAQNKMGYVKPPAQIKEYADAHGLELIAPYSAPNNNQVEMNTLRDDNADLKDLVKQLIEQNKKIMASKDGEDVNTDLPSTKEVGESETIAAFTRMNKNQLKGYIGREAGVIATWPEHVKTKLRERYTKIVGDALQI
jgi:hypothetical protein